MSDNFNEFEDYSNVTELKWWEKLRYIFISPKNLYKSIKFYPNLKLPIIVIALAVLLKAFLEINSGEFIDDVIESMGGTAPSGSTLNAFKYMAIAITPLIPLFSVLFKGFMISGLSIMVGGDGDYKEAVMIVAYAYLPVAIGGLILSLISYPFGINTIELSLAQILPQSMIGTLFYGIALRLDILVIWYQILALIGTTYVFEIPRKKALVPVIVPWIIWIIFTAGMHVLSYAGI